MSARARAIARLSWKGLDIHILYISVYMTQNTAWLWILDHFENRLSISRMWILFKSWLYASVPFFVVSHVTTTYLQVLLVSSLTPDNCMLKTLFNIELCYWRLFSQSLLVQITAITCQEFLELHRTNQKFF